MPQTNWRMLSIKSAKRNDFAITHAAPKVNLAQLGITISNQQSLVHGKAPGRR
jgi:hypothetical protein